MKRGAGAWIGATGVLLCFPLALFAGDIEFGTPAYEVLHGSGSPAQHINLVILGDGFAPSDMSDYRAHAVRVKDWILATQPFKDCRSDINIFVVHAVSAESGITQIPYFITDDVNLDFLAIERRNTPFDLCAVNPGKYRTHRQIPGARWSPRPSGREDGPTTYEIALSKIPGLSSAHFVRSIILVNDEEGSDSTLAPEEVSIGAWSPPAISGAGQKSHILHEAGHLFDLGEEYDGLFLPRDYLLGLFSGILRVVTPEYDRSWLPPNVTSRNDLDSPTHKWNGYSLVWGIHAPLLSEFLYAKLYSPTAGYCWMTVRAHRPEYDPICRRAIRTRMDDAVGRPENPAPELTSLLFHELRPDGSLGPSIPVADGALLHLTPRTKYRAALAGNDSDAGRSSQPHSLRFYLLFSTEKKSGMDPFLLPVMEDDASKPILGTAQFGSRWLTRSEGGSFSCTAGATDWTADGFFAYDEPGLYTAKAWALDSGGRISAPRAFKVEVTP